MRAARDFMLRLGLTHVASGRNAFGQPISERVVLLAGRLVRAGAVDPFAEKPGSKASSATSYCWFVWLGGGLRWRDTRLRWIAPCRTALERAGDYPDYAAMRGCAGDMAGNGLFGEAA